MSVMILTPQWRSINAIVRVPKRRDIYKLGMRTASTTNLVAIVATVLVILGLLVLVFKLAAEHCAGESTEDAVAAHLVAAEVSGCTATKSAHQTAVAFLLHGWIAAAILLAGLSVSVLALRVLILTIGTLLRELVLRLRAGVASLLILAEGMVRQKCFETSTLSSTYPCCWL